MTCHPTVSNHRLWHNFVSEMTYQWLHYLCCQLAYSIEASLVWAAGGAICPGQAAVLGGALQGAVLLTPQLTANVTV